jgi:carbamoyl-phosphate synthase large subunit
MKLTILISSVGRRAQLIDCFRRSMQSMNLIGCIIGIDCSPSAPGAHLVDRFIKAPRCDAPDFLATTLGICEECNVSLLVPTIDTELSVYAKHRADFGSVGTTVAVSAPETIDTCADKFLAHAWFVENGFPTVRQGSSAEIAARPNEWVFPVIAKPRRGSASVGVRILNSLDSLLDFSKDRADLVVEEIASGQEYTVNALVNREGRCVCAVPHRRIEVRAGEVSKGVTVKNVELMQLVSCVLERLPGAYGPLNVQGFLSSDGQFVITEINPRFGGGYPLAYQAGADFPRWLIEELLGLPSSASFDGWRDRLAMLRYDSAVFISNHELENQRP